MKIKKFRSLSFKLTIWYVVILGIIIGIAGIFLYETFKERLMDELEQTLLEIANDVNDEWYWRKGVTWEDAIKRMEDKFGVYDPFIQMVEIKELKDRDSDIRVIEKIIRSKKIPEGLFVLDTGCYYKADRADIDDLVYRKVTDKKLSSYPLRVILFPVRGPNIVQVGISLKETTNALKELLFILIMGGPLLVLFSSLGGSFIIRKALQPVKSAVKTANEISADDLSLRIDSRNRKDEIGALVDTFNEMITRLEKSVKKIRQFSGDVSHELRTPVTIIRGEIEVLLRKERKKEEYKDILKSVLEETLQMEKIIDELLFLSRIEAVDKWKLNADLHLDDVLLKVFESREQTALRKKLEFYIKEVTPVSIKGDKDFLKRLIANIIDNAIRYTPPKGKVEVSLEKKEGCAQICIQDTGIGIPKESLPFIFDRFYVVDKSRSKESGGFGLGLSIAKWVADIHSASIDVQSKINQGTIIKIRFPL